MGTEVNKRKLAPDNVIGIPVKIGTEFFRHWMEFLKPLHNLTEREIDVATAFLKRRYDLSTKITDPDILDKYIMNEETKRLIREDCGITLAHFQVIMGKLRKSNIIIDGRINPKYIPNIKEGSETFQLTLLFIIK